MTAFTEPTAEGAAPVWLGAIGGQIAHASDIAPDLSAAERRVHGEVVLAQRLSQESLPR